MYQANAQSKQQLVLHADTKFNYKVNNLIENMKYVLYDANIEFNAEKRAHGECIERYQKHTLTHSLTLIHPCTHTHMQTLSECSEQRLLKSVDAETHTNGQTANKNDNNSSAGNLEYGQKDHHRIRKTLRCEKY